MPYFWSGGDGECAKYAITKDAIDPSAYLNKKYIDSINFDPPKTITKAEADVLTKFIEYIYDLREEDY